MNGKTSAKRHRSSRIIYSFFKLIRPLNLFIIAFTMFMVRYADLLPEVRLHGGMLMINKIDFSLFVLAIVLMAAAGYVINDYYDFEIDEINKPDKVIIGRYILPSRALALYQLINLAGLVIGCYAVVKMDLPWKIYDLPWLAALFPFYMVVLWLYARYFKAVFFVGNFLVALCIGLVPLVTGATELAFHDYSPDYTIYFISIFAFLATLAREIAKDIEDMDGDAKFGCKTIPIVIGQNKTKRIVQLILVLLFMLVCIWEYYANIWLSNLYLLLFVELPILLLIVKVSRSKTNDDFHKIGNRLKVLMVFGICYLFVLAYLFFKVIESYKNYK